jgi:hypothetical protein
VICILEHQVCLDSKEHVLRFISNYGKFLCEICKFIHTSVACPVGPSVTTSSLDFSFENLVFWNFFKFSAAEIT